MENKKIKHIRSVDKSQVLDLTKSKELILTFLSESISTKEISVDKLSSILPAFYSVCYHDKIAHNSKLPKIGFYLDYDTVPGTYGYSRENNVYLYDNLLKGGISEEQLFNLTDSIFHEISHISEQYNPELKSKTVDNPIMRFCLSYEGFVDGALTVFENNIGSNNFHCNQPESFEIAKEEIQNYCTKLYATDFCETLARKYASSMLSDLLDYGFNQSENKDLYKDKLYHLSFFKKFNSVSDRVSLKKVSQYTLSEETKLDLDKFRQAVQVNFDTEIEKRASMDISNTKEILKQKFAYEKYIPFLIDYVGFCYDETIAYDLAEQLLDINEKFPESSPVSFAKLVQVTPYSPTREQLERCAKSFRTNLTDNRFDINTTDFKTPMTDFIIVFSTGYSDDFLLDLYSTNNLEFLSDLVTYEDTYHELEQSDIDTARNNYLTKSNLARFITTPTKPLENKNSDFLDDQMDTDQDTNTPTD